MRACSVGDRRKTTSNVVDQSTRSANCACASSSVVSLVWVPRARPQTYHFFGDSRRGNILVLVLVLVLASSPRHHEFDKVLARSSVSESSLNTRIFLFLPFVPFPCLFYTCYSLFITCLSSIRFGNSISVKVLFTLLNFVGFLPGVSRAFRYLILSFFSFSFFFFSVWMSVPVSSVRKFGDFFGPFGGNQVLIS